MRRRHWVAALGFAVASALSAQEAAVDLKVRVFTTQTVKALHVVPVGEVWLTPCPGCARQRVGGPFDVSLGAGGMVQAEQAAAARSVELAGSVRITPVGEAGGEAAREAAAAGIWRIAPAPRPATGLRVVLTMPSERYVAAVLAGEAAPDEPAASLAAMAVVARTFALTNLRRHAAEGFDLCDSTHCQALRLGAGRAEIERAVLETAGETLWFHGRRAAVYYAQSCGGTTEDVSAVWPEVHAPYLAAHPDPYCVRRNPALWHADLPLAQLAAVLRGEGFHTPTRIEAVRVVKKTASGRNALLEVTGGGAAASVSASSLRFAVDRALGWSTMRSDAYEVSVAGGQVHMTGRGFGHGVGLCQFGAFEMAREGKASREILGFYFPGTTVGITANDAGWKSVEANGWTLRTVSTGDATLQQAGDAAWLRARQLFPPRSAVHPEVFFAPTTELFRQMTGEPGWTLASTRGERVVLQPEAVLRRNKGESSTLLHELLHVLVEHEAGTAAPLWLREGIVEALAAPAAPSSSKPLKLAELEAMLAPPADADASRRAHAGAEALVRQLIARYGGEAVRGWLGGGVPAGVLRGLG